MRNSDEMSKTAGDDVRENMETGPRIPDDHVMSEEESELMMAQLAKQVAQNEKHKFQSQAAEFGERTDSAAAESLPKTGGTHV